MEVNNVQTCEITKNFVIQPQNVVTPQSAIFRHVSPETPKDPLFIEGSVQSHLTLSFHVGGIAYFYLGRPSFISGTLAGDPL